MYIFTSGYTHTSIYIYIYIYIYLYTYTYIHIHTYVQRVLEISAGVGLPALATAVCGVESIHVTEYDPNALRYAYLYMYACTCMCMYVYEYVCVVLRAFMN
jgi:hypothetical protein